MKITLNFIYFVPQVSKHDQTSKSHKKGKIHVSAFSEWAAQLWRQSGAGRSKFLTGRQFFSSFPERAASVLCGSGVGRSMFLDSAQFSKNGHNFLYKTQIKTYKMSTLSYFEDEENGMYYGLFRLQSGQQNFLDPRLLHILIFYTPSAPKSINSGFCTSFNALLVK